MKKLFLLFLPFLLALALPAAGAEQVITYFNIQYDLDSATTTYCSVTGPHDGYGTVTSSGTTVTGSASDSFTGLAATDVLLVGTQMATITAVASGTSLTVSAAPTTAFAAQPWKWYDTTCGTAATNGWVNVSGWNDKTAIIQVEAGATTSNSLDVVWECKGSSPVSSALQVFPDNWPSGVGTVAVTSFLDANFGTKQGRRAIRIPEPWSECRIGMLLTDDSSDATIEDITAYIIGIKE
jgi:hypothetical protein